MGHDPSSGGGCAKWIIVFSSGRRGETILLGLLLSWPYVSVAASIIGEVVRIMDGDTINALLDQFYLPQRDANRRR